MSPAAELVIAVLTYRRPDDLQQIVPALLAQLDGVVADWPSAEVLVIDNDPDGGARATLEGTTDPRVRYVHEPTPGIASARNRALAEVEQSRVLVFIDDDERPSPPWLASLLGTYREHSPAGVLGPVISVFDTTPEPWIMQGGFFTRRRMPTGSVVDVAATNNLLLDLDTVRRLNLRFDDRYGLLGGSDHLFTRQLVTSGGVLMWNDDAIVHDKVPASRATRSWVIRRAYRIGTTASLVALDLADTRRERGRIRLNQTFYGSTRLFGGAARYSAGVVTRSVGRRGAGVRNCARGAGLIAGAFGRSYAEYERPAAARQLSTDSR